MRTQTIKAFENSDLFYQKGFLFLGLNLQLRVVRAFKSTLEDMEERRSVHSLQCLRTSRSHPGPRPLSDISFIDEEVNAPSLNDYPIESAGPKNPTVGPGVGNLHAQTNTASKHPPPTAFRHQQSLNTTATTGSGPGLNETAPLLAKEPQMERSRSAPFTSLHPIATNLQYNQTTGSSLSLTTTCLTSTHCWSNCSQNLGPNQRHLTPSSAARQTAVLNNPLVQGYHLLAEPNRIHETSIWSYIRTQVLIVCQSLLFGQPLIPFFYFSSLISIECKHNIRD